MRKQILSSLIFAGAIIVSGLGLKYLAAHGVISSDSKDLGMRFFGVSTGLLVAWVANLSSKRLKPIDAASCGPEGEQNTRRFSAITITIGGLLYAISWIASPLDYALTVSMVALGATVVVVLARCISVRVSR